MLIPLSLLPCLPTSSLLRGVRKMLHRKDQARTTYFSYSVSLIKCIKITTRAAEIFFTCGLAVRPQQITNNNCKLLFYLRYLVSEGRGYVNSHI